MFRFSCESFFSLRDKKRITYLIIRMDFLEIRIKIPFYCKKCLLKSCIYLSIPYSSDKTVSIFINEEFFFSLSIPYSSDKT